MNGYLLDTDICIYFLKGMYQLGPRMQSVGVGLCFLSEITIVELKFGAANSLQKETNQRVYNTFIEAMQIVPILSCLDFYADEKARLRKSGAALDDFDLLIGSSAVVNDLTLVFDFGSCSNYFRPFFADLPCA